ncbi:MAG: L-fuculose-phosphate aldolase [Chitinivibrionales bacterium]
MTIEEMRESIVKFGKKLITSNLTTGSGGNISIINREQGVIAISPSGLEYFETGPQDIPVMDLKGKVVYGDKKPSSEKNFHIGLYETRPDITSVVHTHSPYATTFACLGMEIPAIHYLVGFSGKKVPIAPYETFGTPALAERVKDYIGGYNALLLEKHGLICIGNNIETAFAVAEEIEYVARLYFQAKTVGEPETIPDEEMERVIEKFKTYGQK